MCCTGATEKSHSMKNILYMLHECVALRNAQQLPQHPQQQQLLLCTTTKSPIPFGYCVCKLDPMMMLEYNVCGRVWSLCTCTFLCVRFSSFFHSSFSLSLATVTPAARKCRTPWGTRCGAQVCCRLSLMSVRVFFSVCIEMISGQPIHECVPVCLFAFVCRIKYAQIRNIYMCTLQHLYSMCMHGICFVYKP